MLPKFNVFKQYYVRLQELVFLAHDDIVACGKGIRTQEIKIVSLCWFYF